MVGNTRVAKEYCGFVDRTVGEYDSKRDSYDSRRYCLTVTFFHFDRFDLHFLNRVDPALNH